MTVEEALQQATVVYNPEEDEYEASVIYRGIDTIGLGGTRAKALKKLKFFLEMTEEEYRAGRV